MDNNIDYLIEKYPDIFQDYEGNPGRVNWSCPPGWIPIVDSLCSTIQSYITNNNFSQIVCVQVKEKFGGLRFYYEPRDLVTDYLVSMAERLSRQTCLDCGATSDAEIRNVGGWLAVLCDKCNSESQADEKLKLSGFDSICFDCARKMGGEYPEGHAATMNEDACSVCGDIKGVVAVNDFIWPSSSKKYMWD